MIPFQKEKEEGKLKKKYLKKIERSKKIAFIERTSGFERE
jgi:hypothetical protein